MKFSFVREQLLSALQMVIGAVEKRQTMPILSNVLLRANNHRLQLVGTDLEIELIADTEIPVDSEADVTVPARKFLDICKNLPEDAEIKFSYAKDRVTLNSGRSRFVLATLPAADFPALDEQGFDVNFKVSRKNFRELIERTGFAMAQQDVRYYLNGLLLECRNGKLRAVATDGHRLALADATSAGPLPEGKQVIIPRKGVTELQRLLGDSEDEATVFFSGNHVRVEWAGLRYTSKLIDGRFPDYERVMPADGDKTITADRSSLKQSLTRTSILSNEKYRGVRFIVESGLLKVQTQNPDKEEAEEELEIDYQGDALEVAFNVNYVLDVLNVVTSGNVRILLKDANSSCIIRAADSEDGQYVIMPMRL
jgi:DNA polymerase-3 subunit beta